MLFAGLCAVSALALVPDSELETRAVNPNVACSGGSCPSGYFCHIYCKSGSKPECYNDDQCSGGLTYCTNSGIASECKANCVCHR